MLLEIQQEKEAKAKNINIQYIIDLINKKNFMILQKINFLEENLVLEMDKVQ